MCIQESNVAGIIDDLKSTATKVKCPRGYRYINHAAAFISLFRQLSTVRNFALNRYPIAVVGAKNEIFYFISNFADTEGARRSITRGRARSVIVGHL